MAEVIWAPSARRDLLKVLVGIEAISKLYAKRFAEQVDAQVLQLEQFPSLGHPVPEFGLKSLRQVVIGNYRFIYWDLDGHVHIVRIWHAARLLRLVHIKH